MLDMNLKCHYQKKAIRRWVANHILKRIMELGGNNDLGNPKTVNIIPLYVKGYVVPFWIHILKSTINEKNCISLPNFENGVCFHLVKDINLYIHILIKY